MASSTLDSTLARVLRPEDVRPGIYVAVLYRIIEFLPTSCLEDHRLGVPQPVRLRWLPWDGGAPLKVKDVCLPFVLVRPPKGRRQVLDVRRVELARLDSGFARRATAELRRRRKRK
ncbi:MAG: hypothetical protein GY715_04465 [Planctomycetes bacterium]|nr:hypothetical protein [Planctomycetota bacterium]